MKLQVGVKTFLQRDDGKFLLLKRSSAAYPDIKDLWDIPGGRIKPGSPLIDNLRREVDEESGLSLKGEPVLIAAQDILRNSTLHVVRLTYMCGCVGDVNIDNDEVDEYAWVVREEMSAWKGLDEYAKEAFEKLPKET